jgi:hypothetical protein
MSEIRLIVDWAFILTLSEIIPYLERSDILITSQVSKLTRVKLQSKIFNNIDIVDLLDTVQSETSLDNRNIPLTTLLLNLHFNSIKKLVKSIKFDKIIDPLTAPLILDYFENVINLNLMECILPIEIITKLLKNLTNLTGLKMNYCLILFPLNTSTVQKSINIRLPKKLKNLELAHTAGLSTTFHTNTKKFINEQTLGNAITTPVNLQFSTKSCSLRSLQYIKGNDKNLANFKRIIKNNLEVERMELYMDQLTQSVMKYLERCIGLRSVVILPANGALQEFEVGNCPKLNSVKSLNIYDISAYTDRLLFYITQPFPNITHLIVSNPTLWKGQVHTIIKSLNKLQQLTVYSTHTDDTLTDFVISSNSLVTLEFLDFSNINFKFNLLFNCPRIYRVRIGINWYLKGNIGILRHKLLKSENWKLVEIKDFINCYKIK